MTSRQRRRPVGGSARAPGSSGRPAPQARARTPVEVDRDRLYTPDELYGDGDYADSPDARAWAWSLADDGRDARWRQAVHDHAVDEALDGWLEGRTLVGVMGGHAVTRDEPAYADAARLGRALARAGLTVTTGGGPGAMEAANLGALHGSAEPADLDRALAELSTAPTSGTGSDPRSVDAWLAPARRVRAGVTRPCENLGVPTWFYGHEPSNVFATAIAKYFRNALREAILLQICSGGIVFLPGFAGTVQEIFQDACENVYATGAEVAPMVLVGRRHWTEELPAWPLLHALAQGHELADRIHLVDDVDQAAGLLTGG